MAGFFGKIMNFLKFQDEDEDEEYDAYLDEFNEKENKRQEKEASVSKKQVKTEPVPVSAVPVKTSAVQREENKPKVVTDNRKVIPMRPNKEVELKVIKPTEFSDCQDICDILLGGDSVIINIEGLDSEISQRIMDFVSGTVYAIRGSLSPVSRLIYIVSPENVSISGDVLNLITSGGVDAPVVSGHF